ncbi:MAG: diguanylate cyclase [Bacteroidetes bacterium]|nr:MAG: diguanylate cyclase [Bacteroidota bacterium]
MKIGIEIVKSLEALVDSEENLIANLANTSSLLMSSGNYHWVGFYFVDKEQDELVLGPFQGPIACTRLKRGRGVCAKSWESKKTIYVEDVESFEGHIACSSLSKSEVVIPLIVKDEVVAVLDIDSAEIQGFSLSEISIFESIVKVIQAKW